MIPNTHPVSGPGNGLLGTLKSNPFGALLAGLFMLALIIPPRKRKYKPKRKKSRKKGKGYRINPSNPGSRVKKGKKAKKSRSQPKAPVSRARKPSAGPRRSAGTGKMPERFRGKVKKGSQIAKEKGEWLRSQRKK